MATDQTVKSYLTILYVTRWGDRVIHQLLQTITVVCPKKWYN